MKKVLTVTMDGKRIPPRSFPISGASSAVFFVHVVAVLFYEPIFTQPLSFGLCAAGTVKKFATDKINRLSEFYLFLSSVLRRKRLLMLLTLFCIAAIFWTESP